jgi:hypothetical protein
MLATVALYFQQLPSAQLLFQLHKEQADAASRKAAVAQIAEEALSSVATTHGHGMQQQLQQWQPDQDWQEQRSLMAPVKPGCQGDCSSRSASGMLVDSSRGGRAVDEAASQQWSGGTSAKLNAAAPIEVTAAAGHSRCASTAKLQQLQRHCSSADSLQQLQYHQQQHKYVVQINQYDVQQQNNQRQQQHSCDRQKLQSSTSLVASLLLKVRRV